MRKRLRTAAEQTFSSLKVRNYRLFFTGQTASLGGTWMQTTAQAWLVLTLTHSSTDLGIVIALQSLPILLLAPYGGVVADRADKRSMLVALELFMGLQAVALGTLVLTDVARFWEVCLLASVLGLSSAFETPTRQSFVREMVGTAELRNAVTLNSVMQNVARAVGPAIAGVLIASVGDAICFFANAASFLAVVASLVLMDPAALHRAEPANRNKGQLREGLHYALHTPEIALPLALMAVVGMLAYEFQVSLPVLARVTFRGGPEAYGFMTTSMGVGAICGGLFTAARGRLGVRSMLFSVAAFGVGILALALCPVLGLAYVVLFFVGWASISFISRASSTIQINAASEMRGRAIALWQVAFQGTTPIGGPLIGWIIDRSNPRVGLGVGAGSCFVAALGGLLLARRFRRRATIANAPADDLGPLAPATAPMSGERDGAGEEAAD